MKNDRMFDGRRMRLGSDLAPSEQAHARAAYVHRFTRQHVPAWARSLRPNGKPYSVQFASDADWLAHTFFPIDRVGKVGRGDCWSTPTRPDGVSL